MPSASEILKKHESRIQRAVNQTPRVQRKGPTRPWQVEASDKAQAKSEQTSGEGSRVAAEKAAAEKAAAEKAAAEKAAAEKVAAEKVAAEKAAAEKVAAEKVAAEKVAAEKAAAEKAAAEKAAAEKVAAEKVAAEKVAAEKAAGAAQDLPSSSIATRQMDRAEKVARQEISPRPRTQEETARSTLGVLQGAPKTSTEDAVATLSRSSNPVQKGLPEAAASLLNQAHLLGFDLAMKFEILSKMADSDGVLRFSQPELAAYFKVSVLTVKRLLTDLCDRGKLKLIREYDPKLRNPTEYQIL